MTRDDLRRLCDAANSDRWPVAQLVSLGAAARTALPELLRRLDAAEGALHGLLREHTKYTTFYGSPPVGDPVSNAVDTLAALRAPLPGGEA